MRSFFHFAMSRRDWIRNTRRERIVYIPVESDGGAINPIMIKAISVSGTSIPLSNLSPGTGSPVSIPRGGFLLQLSKASGQNGWVCTITFYSDGGSAVVASGSYYYSLPVSSVSFLTNDDAVVSQLTVGTASTSNNYDETAVGAYFFPYFQFDFSSNE